MPAEPRSWIRLAVVGAALGLGAWLRLRGLASLPLHGDEHHTLLFGPEHADLADVGYRTILTTFDGVGSHVALPLLQRISMDLFGPGVLPFRLVAIVPGLLLLVLSYPLLCAFASRDAAALATFALAVNPMVVYYARFARGYALALLLALLLGWAVRRVLDPPARGRTAWTVLVGSAALLPWVHLSTLGFVLAVALAGLALAARESRALALRLLAAFAAAGTLALLSFLPVLGQVLRYFREMESEPPPSSWLGVPTLLAGGRGPAFAWLVLLPLGVALAWRERRASAVLALAALLGPLALLVATDPRGMDYAWARYVLSALPFLAALAASAKTGLAARFAGSETHGLVLGSTLLLLQLWRGPIELLAPRDGSFSNTYLAMHRLEAFDEPYPDTPEFYRTLADDPSVRRIVEFPPLPTRAVLLYRNYALVHRKPVVIGWTGELPRGIQRGPYARLLDLGPEVADAIVLHRDQESEVPAYFRHVFEVVWPRLDAPGDETFMRRQETIYPQNLAGAEHAEGVARKLVERHGPPVYEDERIQVWRLAP